MSRRSALALEAPDRPIRLDVLIAQALVPIGLKFGLTDTEARNVVFGTLKNLFRTYSPDGMTLEDMQACAETSELASKVWLTPASARSLAATELADELEAGASLVSFQVESNIRGCAVSTYRNLVIDQFDRPNRSYGELKKSVRLAQRPDRGRAAAATTRTDDDAPLGRKIKLDPADWFAGERRRQEVETAKEIVAQVLAASPAKYRRVMDLVFDGIKPIEIATLTGLDLDAVRNIINRFHGRCRMERGRRS